MTFYRDWVCWLLLAAALACFAIGLWPRWSDGVDPENGDKVSEFRLGLWDSPVYASVHREYLRTTTDERGTWTSRGGFKWEAGVRWLAWSWLVVAAGFVCLGLLSWRREALAGKKVPPDEPSTRRAGG